MTALIQTALVHVSGDPSVGIPHTDLYLRDLGLDWDGDKAVLEHYRARLQACFGEIYDGRASVLFDFEAEELCRAEKVEQERQEALERKIAELEQAGG